MESEIPPDGWSPLLALQRAAHATLHALAVRLAELHLTASEINVLANLADGRPRTATDLSAATGTRPSTLTSVLDRLERRGHLVRGAHTSDRRAISIQLTPAGQAAAGTIRRAMAELEHQALAGLPETTLAGLRVGLQALTEMV